MSNTRVRSPSRLEVPRRLKPRKTPAQSRSRALVEAVVEAATRVLVEKGWDGLTMQEVADRAGVSPGSLYQYFPDKASVVTEIVERQSERELAFHLQRFAAISPEAPLVDKLTVMFRAIIDFQAQEGMLWRRTIASLPHLGRYEALSQRSRQAADVLEALLVLHREELPGLDPALATHVLSNAVHSLTHDGVLPRPDAMTDERLLESLVRLARGYLGV